MPTARHIAYVDGQAHTCRHPGIIYAGSQTSTVARAKQYCQPRVRGMRRGLALSSATSSRDESAAGMCRRTKASSWDLFCAPVVRQGPRPVPPPSPYNRKVGSSVTKAASSGMGPASARLSAARGTAEWRLLKAGYTTLQKAQDGEWTSTKRGASRPSGATCTGNNRTKLCR